MSFAILGLNHKTAPVALREKVAFSPSLQADVLFQLKNHPLIEGVFLISTCNRTEIYLSIDPANEALVQKNLQEWLAQYHKLDRNLLSEYLYWYYDEAAIQHLMRVCAGLDSLVLGEPQILGQVKEAYHLAKQTEALNSEMMKVVERAFRVAKRVRTETGVGANSVSVASTVYQLIQQLNIAPQQQVMMLIGAGETIELIARYLASHHFKKVIVANRTPEKALAITKYIEAEIISLPDIASRLQEADIVISSTASPLPIIGKGMVERSLVLRHHKPMLFIDIAVPRDVEPEVSDLSNVSLYSVDDLQAIVNNNKVQRHLAAQEAEFLVHKEAIHCVTMLRMQKMNGIIKHYRQHATHTKKQLTNQAIQAVQQGQDVEQVIEKLTHLLSQRLMHFPTSLLRETLSTQDHSLFQLTSFLGRDSTKFNQAEKK